MRAIIQTMALTAAIIIIIFSSTFLAVMPPGNAGIGYQTGIAVVPGPGAVVETELLPIAASPATDTSPHYMARTGEGRN